MALRQLGVAPIAENVREMRTLGISPTVENRQTTRTIGLSPLQSNTAKPDLKTSAGLYNLAEQNGLGNEARKTLAQQGGEDPKQIFSGGFITDIFDGLNALQYGVVGVMKGTSFIEGVKTRQSWSDDDALGDLGIPGVIAGIALDIASDPLTYIAPWTILKKIPGLAKGAKAIKAGLFGKLVPKTFKTKAGVKAVQELSGGTKMGRYIGDKLVWMFGADPIFKETWERGVRNIGVGVQNILDIPKGVAQLPGEVASKALKFDDVGRISRVKDVDLKKILSGDNYKAIKRANDTINELGKQQVKLGILSEDVFKNSYEEYIGNKYMVHELPQGKKLFGSKKVGFRGTGKRSETLTKEGIEKLGQIKDPGYLYFKTIVSMKKDIETVKLFNEVATNWASETAQKGFVQLPKSKALLTTSTGKKIGALADVKKLNKATKPLLRQLKSTYKTDKRLMSVIKSIDKNVDVLSGLRKGELEKFFADGAKVTKTFKATTRIGTLPDDLVGISRGVKKFGSFDDLMKSDIGLKLDNLDASGKLERLGFKNTKDFFDYVKNPYKRTAEVAKEVAVNGRADGLRGLLKKLQGKKSVEDIRNFLSEASTAKSATLKKSLGKITSIRGIGNDAFLDLQKIGIKNIDDLVNINKTGGFLADDTFDSLLKLRKYFGDNTENVVRAAEEVAGKNSAINDVLSVLKQFDNKEDIVKGIEKQIAKVTKNIEAEDVKGLSKLVKLQKQIEELTSKSSKLSAIDKRSINDSFRFLDDALADIAGKKADTLDIIDELGLGELSGKWVPESMHKNISEMSEPAKYTLGKKMMGEFKFAKVIMNPATHARNIVSNKILNWWKLGMNPLSPKTIDAEKLSFGEIFHKGGKWMDEAKQVGYDVDTFAANELMAHMKDPQMEALRKTMGGRWANFKNRLGGIYQAEENQAKLSAFIFNRKYKGLGAEDAWKAAESATFNYAQVTPFVRKLRTSLFGFPFITFTAKATPLAVETALKAPGRISVFGKVKSAIESQSDPDELAKERASEAPWIRDGFYIKLPIKDKHGRSAYFDMTYIIPFGDLMSGQFLERGTDMKTGQRESIPSALMSKAPALNFLKEIGKNQDFYGNNIWKDSDNSAKQLQDLFRHLTKTMAPPLVADQIPGGYNAAGERQQRGFLGAMSLEDEIRQKRTVTQELLRTAGMKIQPIQADVQESYSEWNKKKALQTLLRENGILSEFNIQYQKNN